MTQHGKQKIVLTLAFPEQDEINTRLDSLRE